MAAQDPIEAIHTAAINGEAVGVARMLDEDLALLSSEWDGETLLTQAALNRHGGVVRLLLERGADVNTPNDSGDTALHLAAVTGNEEVVSILLGSGADIFRRGGAGWTVLMNACSSGSVAVVRLLLRAMEGHGLDERSRSGYTALWWACLRGRVDIVLALLLAGADHTIPDDDGDTPQQVAQTRGYHRCVELIQVSSLCSCVLHNTPQRCICTMYVCIDVLLHRRYLMYCPFVWCSGGRASCSVPMSSTRPGRYTKTPPRANKPLQPQCPPT
jgi:ankyrin repeat protein